MLVQIINQTWSLSFAKKVLSRNDIRDDIN